MERFKYKLEIITGLLRQEARRELSESWKLSCYQAGRAVTGANPRTPKDNHWPESTLVLFIHHWLEKFPKEPPSQQKIGLSEFKKGLVEGIWERYDESSPELAEGTFPYKGLYPLRMAAMEIEDNILSQIGSGSKKGQKAMAGFAGIYMKRIYPVVPFNAIMPSLSIPVWMNIN